MFLSIIGFSLMDVIVKWSVDYPIGQILFFRGFFGIIFYFFIIPRDRLHNFYKTKRPGLHSLRCIAGLIAIVAIFIALRKLPLATVVSISFAAPIFTTIFSIFLLSERVGVYRWLAVLVGFIGIFGGVSNLWLSQSYKYSEVSLVTPLKYLTLVFAIIFGYFIWDEIPTIKTLVGAFLVIISTLIIFRREIYKKNVITSKLTND